MMKKRFLLALIAASMSLAGCGKNKTEPTPEPTPGPVDPGDEGLTPEQQKQSNEIKKTLDDTLSFAFSAEVVAQCDEYTVAYSEEIAKDNVNGGKVTVGITEILKIAFSGDESAIVEFLIDQKADGNLKDTLYGTVALGKSFLRAASMSNDESAKGLAYVANYLDKEGTALHSNLYGLLDSTVGCVATFMTPEFMEAVASIYDAEKKEVSFEGLSSVLTTAGSAIVKFSAVSNNVDYLVDLVTKGAVGYAELVLELDPEVIEFIESLDFSELVQTIFGYVGAAGYGLASLASEDSPLAYVVDCINLVLAEKYFDLVFKLANDYLELIEADVTFVGILTDVGPVIASVMSVAGYFQSEEFAEEFKGLVDEHGDADVEKIKTLLGNIAKELGKLSETDKDLAKLIDDIVDVVKHSLIYFEVKTVEEVEEMFADFDSSELVAPLYSFIDSVCEFLNNSGDEKYALELDLIKGIVEAFAGEEKEALEVVSKLLDVVLTYLFAKFDIQSVSSKEIFAFALMMVPGVPYAIYNHLSSEDFTALIEGALSFDEKTGAVTINEEGLLALLADIGSNVVGTLTNLEDPLIMIVDVVNEIVSKINGTYDPEAEEDPESTAAQIKAAIVGFCAQAEEIAKLLNNDEGSLEPYMDQIIEYGNLVLEGIGLFSEFKETGAFPFEKAVEYIARVVSLISGYEPEELSITSFDEIPESIYEAIDYDLITESLEEEASFDLEFNESVSVDVIENEGVYSLQVIYIAHAAISADAGAITEVDITGAIYTFPLPELQIMPVSELA